MIKIVINIMILSITSTASAFSVGEHVVNKWNWNYSTQWAALGENCTRKMAGEIEFEVLDSSKVFVLPSQKKELVSIGDADTQGKSLGVIVKKLKISADESIVEVKSFKGDSNCLSEGQQLVIKSIKLRYKVN